MKKWGEIMEKKYAVSEEELIDLLAAYYILSALESGGVDNWDWYSESKKDWLEMNASEHETFEDVARSELDNYVEVE